ncbi:zinc ribbon domain-containing protein [Candidatus Bathyarchaeota archaeon]|nr:zinc ribbon domain-containing protein [Candidatus Bathyarchaeota archaeon]
MSDILGKLKSGAEKVAEKIDETVDVQRIQMQIHSLKNQIEEQYQKLGQMTYDSNLKNESTNPEAAGIIAKITELKQQIVANEEEIKNRKEDKVVSQAATPDRKFCAKCGKENNANSKFCNYCGAEMV